MAKTIVRKYNLRMHEKTHNKIKRNAEINCCSENKMVLKILELWDEITNKFPTCPYGRTHENTEKRTS